MPWATYIPEDNVATKIGRRAIADELEGIANDVDQVMSCNWGTGAAQCLVDELTDIAERLRE